MPLKYIAEVKFKPSNFEHLLHKASPAAASLASQKATPKIFDEGKTRESQCVYYIKQKLQKIMFDETIFFLTSPNKNLKHLSTKND